MTEPLLIVDVQCGFINQFTHHIPQRIARLIRKNEYAPLVFTRFINSTESPYQKVLSYLPCSPAPLPLCPNLLLLLG
jgi:hypothetical protein